MANLGVQAAERDRLLARATGEGTWRSLAALDAAVRDAGTQGGVGGGAPDARIAERLEWAMGCAFQTVDTLPLAAYYARPAPPTDDGVEQVILRGVVIIQFTFPPALRPR